MIRRRILVAAASAVALIPIAATPASAGKAADPVPSRLLVTAREYRFTLSKPKLDAGPAIIQLYNYGEDPHDLKLQRVGGRTISELGEVGPGDAGRLDLKLRRKSRYALWCSISGHESLGMTATLKTSAKRPPRAR